MCLCKILNNLCLQVSRNNEVCCCCFFSLPTRSCKYWKHISRSDQGEWNIPSSYVLNMSYRRSLMEFQQGDDGRRFHVVTPVLESIALSQVAGTTVYMKMENVQPSGSFKIRGIGYFCQQVSDCRKAGTSRSSPRLTASNWHLGQTLQLVPHSVRPLLHSHLPLGRPYDGKGRDDNVVPHLMWCSRRPPWIV